MTSSITIISPALFQISAGFQQVKLGERGGRRRDFHDSGVNTRQMMEHVKESKTGQFWFQKVLEILIWLCEFFIF